MTSLSPKYMKHTEAVKQNIANNKSQVEELKDIYFQELNILDDGSRKRPIVEARMAFSYAFRNYFTLSDIGRAFNKDHATILHYNKVHETLTGEKRYDRYYKTAIYIRGMFLNKETPRTQEQEIQRLKAEVAELIEYKTLYFQLLANYEL